MSCGNMLDEQLTISAEALKGRLEGRNPHIGLVLGSGLNHFADQIEDAIIIPFGEIPSMKKSTVIGHVGRFVCGKVAGTEVLCMQGRLHGYEGNTAQEVAYPIWLMNRIGVSTLITTNAAGAINESYQVGDFCIMKDHINFTGRNPIAVHEASQLAERFFSMTDAYDEDLRVLARQIADQENVRVQEGVYLGLLGPSFETPAEINMFRVWGADTVAMSVVEEVIAARHTGMRVLGISLCSNMAAGIEGSSPDGEEVMQIAKKREGDFTRLMSGILAKLR